MTKSRSEKKVSSGNASPPKPAGAHPWRKTQAKKKKPKP